MFDKWFKKHDAGRFIKIDFSPVIKDGTAFYFSILTLKNNSANNNLYLIIDSLEKKVSCKFNQMHGYDIEKC